MSKISLVKTSQYNRLPCLLQNIDSYICAICVTSGSGVDARHIVLCHVSYAVPYDYDYDYHYKYHITRLWRTLRRC